MTNFLTSVLRTLAQVVVGYVVTWLTARGLDVPEQAQTWALGAFVAGGIFLWTALVRLLETRKGTGAFPVACRRLARVLMLGIGARPAYVPDGGSVQATSDAAGVHTVPFSGPAPAAPGSTGRHAAGQPYTMPPLDTPPGIYAPGRAAPPDAGTIL